MLSQSFDKTENEFEHISRQRMADAIMSVVGGRQTYGGPHNAITVVAPDGREWKAMSDGSLRDGAEFVTPILGWDDLPTYQEYIRAIRRAGAQTPSRLDFLGRAIPTFRECGGLRAEDSLEYSRIWLLLRGRKPKQRKPPKRLVYGG